MSRPKGPVRIHINLAPPADVVMAVSAYAKRLHVPQTRIWEVAVLRYLKEKGVVMPKGEAA